MPPCIRTIRKTRLTRREQQALLAPLELRQRRLERPVLVGVPRYERRRPGPVADGEGRSGGGLADPRVGGQAQVVVGGEEADDVAVLGCGGEGGSVKGEREEMVRRRCAQGSHLGGRSAARDAAVAQAALAADPAVEGLPGEDHLRRVRRGVSRCERGAEQYDDVSGGACKGKVPLRAPASGSAWGRWGAASAAAACARG